MANKNNRQVWLVLTLLVLTSGSIMAGIMLRSPGTREMRRDAYIQWTESGENNLRRTKTIDGITYKCIYQPAPYLAVRHLSSNIPAATIDSLIKHQEGFHYISLEISSEDPDNTVLDPTTLSPETYNARLQYLNAMAQSDLKMTEGGDTLHCTQYLFENPYNLSKTVHLIAAFKRLHPENRDVQLIFDDRLMQNGLIRFTFDQETLNQIPKLIY